MEVPKRCKYCGCYPLCKRIESPQGCCDKWIKRDRGLKLEKKQKEIFEFKKI